MNKKCCLFVIIFIVLYVTVTAQEYIEIQEGLNLYSSLDLDFKIKDDNDIIFLGEHHGIRESKVILKQLILYMYKEHGLRDIALEEDPAFNEHANDYINRKTDYLRTELILRTDVLDSIRDLNDQIEDSKLTVHLIDVDSPKTTIDEHLGCIAEQTVLDELGITGLGEEYVSIDKTIELIERLKNESSNNGMHRELQSLTDSLYLYQHLFKITENSVIIPNKVSQAPIRESVITRNIISVKNTIEDKPLLVFIGAGHAIKSNQIPSKNYVKPAAEQLIENGFKVYSIFCSILSGEYHWRWGKKEFQLASDEIIFNNGITLKSVLSEYENYKSVQLYLNQPLNIGLDLFDFGFKPGTGHLVYDEIIFIDKATPMEH